ncbi:MAG TPA: ABC transporter substrate-binding protein, partial [Solirubrobacteraceae bacterium]|nr:ABC transporter substrate-binding protein [Solirubrobacteraceae bacterium]
FTPVPFTAPNSIQFWSVSVGDNAAAAVYAGKTLGAKKVALMYFSNPQGESIIPQIVPVFKAAGATSVKLIPLSPTSPDPSPQAALIESSGADLAYIDVPNGCGNVLKSLKSVGYSGKLMGIDPCSAPPVITASAGGAEGMYIASPFILATGTSQQAQLFQAAMKKWAAPGTLIDSPSIAGFATVMNVQAALSKVTGALNTTSIEAAFKTGSDHPNFLSHPYTCDGQQMTGAPAICNDYYLMNQVKNGQLTQPSTTDWTTSKGYYKGQGL